MEVREVEASIGPAVRYWRDRNALSQAALAEKAGLAEYTVGLVEGGKVSPRPSTIQKLAGALGVDPLQLTDPRYEEAEARPLAQGPRPSEAQLDELVERYVGLAQDRSTEALAELVREALIEAEAIGLTGIPLERVDEIIEAFRAGSTKEAYLAKTA